LQFAGQGFEDVSALASLILLQEMMMGEEYAMLSHSSVKLTTPNTPTVALRTAGSNETPLSPTSGTLYISITATNYYGETAASAINSSITLTTGSVVDVTIPPVSAGLQYNIYASTTSGAGNQYRIATGVGGIRYTLQGAIPATGVTAPTVDTGTGANTRMEGIIPTLTGKSATSSVYPAGWQGGYYNPSVGTHLSYNAIYTALDGLWESVYTNPGAFRADPAEIVGDGGDLMRLSTDIISQGAATNYRLFLDQPDVGGVKIGAAVSQFQNPITRSILNLVVHPWLTQGTALLNLPGPLSSDGKMGSALFGEPRRYRGIPSISNACWCVETVCAGPDMTLIMRHYVIDVSGQETVRSYEMVNRKSLAEMTKPSNYVT
jgi:hypothetical protein